MRGAKHGYAFRASLACTTRFAPPTTSPTSRSSSICFPSSRLNRFQSTTENCDMRESLLDFLSHLSTTSWLSYFWWAGTARPESCPPLALSSRPRLLLETSGELRHPSDTVRSLPTRADDGTRTCRALAVQIAHTHTHATVTDAVVSTEPSTAPLPEQQTPAQSSRHAPPATPQQVAGVLPGRIDCTQRQVKRVAWRPLQNARTAVALTPFPSLPNDDCTLASHGKFFLLSQSHPFSTASHFHIIIPSPLPYPVSACAT